MTLDDYRRRRLEPKAKRGQIQQSKLADDVLYFIDMSQDAWLITDLLDNFDCSYDALKNALDWLIYVGKLAIDPNRTRYRKYYLDPQYIKIKNLENEPQQQEKKTSARDTMLSLEPTIISPDVEKVIEEEIARLAVVKIASDLNKDHTNDMMISIQDRHVVVMYSPTKHPYKKIKDFLNHIKGNSPFDLTFFNDGETESVE